MLTVLDLFSGIGGFSLGLERTGGFKTAAFCEIEPYCQAVLRKHWPDVPIFDDVTEISSDDLGRFDILCGGPPCQATSVAAAIHGKRSGATLWPWMRSVALLCAPSWIVVEQPTGNAGWEDTVSLDLADIGYSVSRLCGAAGHIGAPHIRRRSFILAHRDSARLQVAWRSAARAFAKGPGASPAGRTWNPDITRIRRVDDGIPGGLDRRKRIHALGNAIVPQVVEVIGRAILETEKAPSGEPEA